MHKISYILQVQDGSGFQCPILSASPYSQHGCEGSHRFLDPSVPWTPLESSPGQYLAAVGTCWKHLETIGTPCWFSIPKRYYSQLKKIRTSEGEWDSAFESNLTEYQVTRAKRISMESENL